MTWWINDEPHETFELSAVVEEPLRRAGQRLLKPRVEVRVEDLVIPTYLPAPPDKNPMFLEKRVYQGSSGKVYPLPFTDRIAEKPVDRTWKAVWIENEFLRAMVLPEIGGRIHVVAGQKQRLRSRFTIRPSSSRRWSVWPGRGFPAASNSTGRSTTGPRLFCR